MKHSRWKRAAAALGRRTVTRAGLATATAGLALWVAGAAAQNTTAPAASNQNTASPDSTQGRKRSSNASLRVVPIPRQRQADAGSPNTAPRPAVRSVPNAAPNNPAPAPAVPATMFAFEFHGTDIDNVLKFFSQISNLTISKDPGLSGPVTIISPKQITLDEAFKVLQSVLQVRGFTALQNGDVLSIVPMDRAVGSTTLVNPDIDPSKIDPRDQVMTQVIPLENVDAETLSKELTPLINKGASLIGSSGTNALIVTDTASNVRRFLELVNALDKTSNKTEMRVYPLYHAEASAIADLITNIYKQTTTRGRAPAPQPGQPPPQPGQPQAGGGPPAVVAVADQRTNSVIVIASPNTQDQIAATIIARLDEDNSDALDTKFRKIKYADAVTVSNMVNTVLSNMHGTGAAQSSGSSFQQRAFYGFGFGYGGDQSSSQSTVNSTDPFGKVTADPRTNTVLITATAERMETIDKLIDELDVDVPVETTTFVFPLKYAQADDVAYALTQAFGTENNNNNPFGFFFFGGGGGNNQNSGLRRQPIQRRLNQQNNNNGFSRAVTRAVPGTNTGGAAATGSATLPNGVPGVMTPNGFIPADPNNSQGEAGSAQDSEPTRQYYGYGRQQRSLGSNGGPQYGRGRNGSYVNLLQLQNNVFVTPSPNGDSLIITTTPDNYKALKQLIEALDVVQPQVMIEVIVAEATLDTDKKLGLSLGGKFFNLFGKTNTAQGTVNLPAAGSQSIFDPLASGGQFVISANNYNALLQAITTDDKIKVISTPRVFTSNNQQAEIDITTEQPYINGQTSSSFINTNISNSVQFAEIGFILNVTPRISRRGLVTVDLQQEASDLVSFATLGTGSSAITVPVINDRYTDTSVTVQDGETIAIGGLIRDRKTVNITKVPLLSEIPLLGQFFRSHEAIRNKVELMIFLTPHVIRTSQDARALAAQEGAGVIKELPDLTKQQPNLNPKAPHPPLIITPTPPDQAPPSPSDSGTSPTPPEP